jgi:hypothetical protein
VSHEEPLEKTPVAPANHTGRHLQTVLEITLHAARQWHVTADFPDLFLVGCRWKAGTGEGGIQA